MKELVFEDLSYGFRVTTFRKMTRKDGKENKISAKNEKTNQKMNGTSQKVVDEFEKYLYLLEKANITKSIMR